MENIHTKSALRFFDYIARRFPVMCASDEFDFLPRAEKACKYYDRIDDLDTTAIHESIFKLKDFQKEFDLLAKYEDNLETLIDLALLKAKIAAILIEFEEVQSWRCNPLLYLKVAFIGLDHALTKPASEAKELRDRTLSRMHAIPELLKQAITNIKTTPESYYNASMAMLKDCRNYLLKVASILDKIPGNFEKELQSLLSSLDRFGRFLKSISPVPDHRFAGISLTARLKKHFLSIRSPDEVFEIALDDWWENLNNLEKLGSKIDPTKSWQELYHSFSPIDITKLDTISLYRNEIEKMRLFFSRHGFREEDTYSSIIIAETPAYLKSVRGTASFSAAFTGDIREESFFFITTHLPEQSSREAGKLLKKRLHREYKYLTAHETFPGHHLLDSVRRRLKNPVRRQIESPLFYEGWACYAESLLSEYGYIDMPVEKLIEYKRKLWRAARCQIDVGLSSGKISRAEAIKLLTTTGFSIEEAKRQIDRFQLNPGYQLCYSLGRYEIMKLKETCGAGMGSKEFHSLLLEGGQLPFHLIEKRFQAKITRQ